MDIVEAAQSYTHQGRKQEPCERLHNMWENRITRVADRMTSSITIVSPESRLGEVLRLFTLMHLKAMAVFDGKEYVGLIGHSFLKEVMSHYVHNPLHVRVKEVMDIRDLRVPPCSPDEPLCDVWNRMRQIGQTDLPVLDAAGKLAGVLSAPVMDEQVPHFEFSETWKRPTPKAHSW